MAGSTDNFYRSETFRNKVRQRSYVFWGIASALVLAWFFLILAAPVSAAADAPGLSGNLYSFFGYVCHQLPDRSFFLFGNKFGVCSRCTGVYLGLAAAMVAYPLLRPMDDSQPLPRFWLFLSMIPIAIDWSLGYFGIWENTHLTRFVSGLILGIGCAVFIAPALVELAETFVTRKTRPT